MNLRQLRDKLVSQFKGKYSIRQNILKETHLDFILVKYIL